VLYVNAPGPLVVEVTEALPGFDCPSCDGVELRGQSRERCHRCNGTRRIGIEGPLPAGVAIDEHDRARFYAEGSLREPGEAVHAVHWCPHTLEVEAA
jgi:hypothetical protein